jgi:hypothetical protein
MEETRQSNSPGAAETKYLMVVGGLMVLIILLLAGLWLRERRISTTARRELAALRRNVGAGGRLQAALGRMLSGAHPASRPLGRDELTSETVTWNGRPREVFRVSPAAGNRVGLRPGDVVVVSTPATTAPAE